MQRSSPQFDHSPRQRKNPRDGFTLIELIVVILVIGILMAIILPALGSARKTAQQARVVTDIKNIEAAIAAFKLKYGIDPPSSFSLYENGQWDLSNALDKNSVALMRQMWPNYIVSASGQAGIVPGDLNGDGTLAANRLVLNGAECLVFFLCGPGTMNLNGNSSLPVPGSVAAQGYSANPTNPFAVGGSRVGPFLEIDSSRLSDVNGNGCYELLDPLPAQTAPYQYFSSYGGRGYQIFGYDSSSPDDDEVMSFNGSKMSSVYLKSDMGGLGNIPKGVAWNAKTFQIISPGWDAAYGVGGLFTVPGTNSIGDGVAVKAGDTYRDVAKRQPEIDNITNFSGGTLGKTYSPASW